MPKTVTLDTFKGRIQLWADESGDMQVTVESTISGGGISQSDHEDITPSLTAVERTTIQNFAKAKIAAAKQRKGM